MRLQSQNSLYVIPLFLLLAVAISLIIGIQERDKTLWGLREQAGSLAVGIAEFVGADGLNALSHDSAQDAAAQNIYRSIDGLLHWGRAKRVYASVRGAGGLLFDLGPWAGDPADLDTSGPASSAPAEFHMLKRPSRGRVMRATAWVRDASRQVAGSVSVETDASALDRLREAWIRESVIRLLTALAVGLVASAVLSWVLKSKIRALGQALETASKGDYSTKLDANFGIIRETTDLAGTFNTMMSLFRGTVARTRRNLLGVERFRTDDDVAHAIDANLWKPRETSRDGWMIQVRAVGALPVGSFFDLVQAEDRIYVLFGRIPVTATLDGTLSASGALSFLRQRLGPESMKAGVLETQDLFQLQDLTVVEWIDADSRLVVHRFDPGARALEAIASTKEPCFRKVFHDLGPEVDRRIRLFLKTSACTSPEDLIKELIMLISAIQPTPRGVLAVVSRDDARRPVTAGSPCGSI